MTFDERVAAYLETGQWDPAWGEVPRDLAMLRERLADRTSWEPAPENGLEAVLAAIALEQSAGLAVDRDPIDSEPMDRKPVDEVADAWSPAAPPPAPTLVDRPSTTAPRRRRGVAAWLGAAATVAVAVVAVLVVARPDTPPDTHTFELAGTDLAPAASATGLVWSTGSGEWFELDVSGLVPAAADEYYAGWVQGDAGVVSIGTFHARDDDTIHLWSGVPVEDYPDVTITLQRVEEGPGSSGDVVLRGRVITD